MRGKCNIRISPEDAGNENSFSDNHRRWETVSELSIFERSFSIIGIVSYFYYCQIKASGRRPTCSISAGKL